MENKMRKFCLLIAMCCFAVMMCNTAYGQYKSELGTLSTPQPFNEIANQNNRDDAAYSTGYFFMDANAVGVPRDAKWKPNVRWELPEVDDPQLWRRVYPGPNSVPTGEIKEIDLDVEGIEMMRRGIVPVSGGNAQEGLRYFRNPAQYPYYLRSGFAGADTTNAAIAGPIPIGFIFHFNGIRYDSFYVSPKGIIALSNRRYYYDERGGRAIPAGSISGAYDIMSADWFAGGNRSRTGNGLTDEVPDNYGFLHIACGGDPFNHYGGIRSASRNMVPAPPGVNELPADMPSMFMRLNTGPNGAAYITPMEGPFILSQYDAVTGRADDHGQVWYKRSLARDRLTIYFRNLQLAPSTGNHRYRIERQNSNDIFQIQEGRAVPPRSDVNVVSGSCQVVLNRIDSSVTFIYNEFYGGSIAWLMQPFSSIAVGGFARHKNYDSQTETGDSIWAGEYIQYTQHHNGYRGDTIPQSLSGQWLRTDIMNNGYQMKFKQWRNSLRVVDIQYFVRDKDNINEFTDSILTEYVQDEYDPIELFAGHTVLGELQPVALVQNLTNDIQGPNGVNFIRQDFQFRTRFIVRNKITDRFVYNRYANVSEKCLKYDLPIPDVDCGNDVFASVRYVAADKDQRGNYIVTREYNNTEVKNGIPPYGFAYVKFPRYTPNEFRPSELGLMEILAITDATDPNTEFVTGDDWPFDDTSRIDFWVINRLPEFRDNVNFHYIDGEGNIPDASKWVHSKMSGRNTVEIVGELNNTNNPLPPLGRIESINDPLRVMISPMMKMARMGTSAVGSKITSFPIDLRGRKGSVVSLSVQRGLLSYNTSRGWADEQLIGPEPRVAFMNGWDEPSGWSTSFQDGFRSATAGRYASTHAIGRNPDFDYLAVEYLKPSPDGNKNITMTGNYNVKNDAYTGDDQTVGNNDIWRYHPYFYNYNLNFGGQQPNQDAPALAIYGGGGYFVGWSFANNDMYYPARWYRGSGLIKYNRETNLYTNTTTTAANNREVVGGFYYNPYDVGFDYEFYKYSVVVPDYFIDGSLVDGGRNFRFRIKFVETNDQGGNDGAKNQDDPVDDDEDAFLIDNIALLFKDIRTDLEASVVKVIWPYRTAPASQAYNVNIVTRVSNMGTAPARNFMVKVKVFKDVVTTGDPIYCDQRTIGELASGRSEEITFERFSPRNFASRALGENVFTLQSIIQYNDDVYKENDTISSEIRFSFSDEFSYSDAISNAVEIATGIEGKGLNLLGSQFAGYSMAQDPPLMSTPRYTSANFPFMQYYQSRDVNNGRGMPWLDYVAGGSLNAVRPPISGPIYSPISGQIAVKFELTSVDSIRGVRAQFAKANQAFDDISFNIYRNISRGKIGDIPGALVEDASLPLIARRLLAKSANGTESRIPVVDNDVLYEFSSPIRLEAGTYWVSIDQRGETGLELAATGQSMGMRTMKIYMEQRDIEGVARVNELGRLGTQLLLDKRLRVPATGADRTEMNNMGFENVYLNNNIFAYKNILGSGNEWQPFMPTEGQVAYAHLDHYGNLASPASGGGFNTFSRGTWMPALKPYFGPKTISPDENTYPCADDEENGPPMSVEITSFVSNIRNSAIELMWETASEINNHSFIIEKTLAGKENWEEVNVVAGAGNSTVVNRYKYIDKDVVSGNTYEYRLYQMDFDGAISCQNSHRQTVRYFDNRNIELMQNSPNPFAGETQIKFYVPTAQNVNLEIVDIFGKVVKTLISNEMMNGEKTFFWNGTNDLGMKVSTGSYLYRLTVGNEVLTKKMSYIQSN